MAAVASAACIAQAAVLVRRFPPIHPVTHERGRHGPGRPSAAWWLSARVVVFVLYLVVLRYWAAYRAAYGFVLIPFVTVVLSAWLDSEPLGVGLLLGGLLVLSGVYVGALRPSTPASTPGGVSPRR